MNFKDFIRVSCAVSAMTAITPALAQEASTGIGDVVVTASKRATNVQDTPIAITAVTQDALTRQGVNQITDITRVAPEITIQTGTFNVVQIRGLRTGQFGPTADSPNATYIDGNYLPRMGGLNGFTYDLERIEVLAGPQGTLFGRNSVGGALNIITRKAELGNFGGTVTADIGNFNQQIFTAAVNIPLTEDLAIRVAGMTNKRDGYFTDTNSGSVEMQGYRLGAKWQPTERDTFTVTADYEVDKPGQGATNTITSVLRSPTIATSTAAASLGSASVVNFGAACPANSTCAAVPINVSDDIWHNRVLTANDYASFRTENDGVNLQWDHDLGFATLTAQYSLRSLDQNNPQGNLANGQQDPRLKAANVLVGTPGIRYYGPVSNFNGQEIRIASNSTDESQFKYVLGVNHFAEKTRNEDIQYASWYSNNSAARPGTVIGALNVPFGADGKYINTGGGQSQLGAIWTDALSVFGEGTFTPAAWDALHITLGARYNWDNKHAIAETHAQSGVGTNYNYYPYPATGQVICPAGTPVPACPKIVVRYTAFDEEKDWERATYKANLQYDLTDRNMVYATWSTGYVSGGYAPGFPQTGGVNSTDHSYNPMTLEAMEIGSKNRFFDNRVQFNFSVYHYDFANYLANVSYRIPTTQSPPSYFSTFGGAANAADTEFEGATFDFEALITDNDRFHINGQYTEGSIEFKLQDLYRNATQAFLQTNGLESDTACVNRAMVGTADGSRATAGTAATCALYAAFLGGSGPPVTNAPLFLGNTLAEFDASGPFERPKWTLNADYTHTFALPNASLDAQVAWHYSSRGVGGNGLISPPTSRDKVVPAGATDVFDLTSRIPEKSTWDANFRYQREDANWSITAYVRNVLDDENLNARAINSNLQGVASWNLNTLQAYNASGLSAGTPNYVYITEGYDPPRTFGVQFQANF